MYADVVEPESLDALRDILHLGTRMGYHAFIVDVSEWDTVDPIYEMGESLSIPMLPLMMINKNHRATEYLGKAIIGIEVSDEKQLRRALRKDWLSVISIRAEGLSILRAKIVNIIRSRHYYKFFEIPLNSLLNASPSDLARVFNLMRSRSKILGKRELRVMFTSRAKKKYDLISPRQLRALLLEAGLSDMAVKRALKENIVELMISPLEILIVRDNRLLRNIQRVLSIWRRQNDRRKILEASNISLQNQTNYLLSHM